MKKIILATTAVVLMTGGAIALSTSNSNVTKKENCLNTPTCICTPSECPDMPGCVCSE